MFKRFSDWRTSYGWALAGLLFSVAPAFGQQVDQLQASKNAAYQKFHNGDARGAAQHIRDLATQTTEPTAKVLLLRDLVEICATANEWSCVTEAEINAFEIANSNPTLRPLIPELYSYLIKALIWEHSDDHVEAYIKSGGPGGLVVSNPPVAAEMHLALHSYFVRKGNYAAAEKAYSAAVLSLLLVDPANKYGISKVLIGMLEALYESQDVVGAIGLADRAEPFLTQYLNHNGLLWAQYKSLTAQIVALVGAHKAAVPALDEASALNARLSMNEGVRTFRLAVANSLSSLSAVLDNRPQDAKKAHDRHPFQTHREEIITQTDFRNIQEFYFGISDLLIHLTNNEKVDARWRHLFERKLAWEDREQLFTKTFRAYRNFALGLIARSAGEDSSDLFILAAQQRLDLFEGVLRQKFEGFAIPSTIDHLLMTTGLSAAASRARPEDYDLLLKGGEMLSRDLRHQFSDFAVLLGSQKDERSRKDAHSYNLLARQKREWELTEIGKLLSNSEKRDKGAILHTYSDLVQTATELKEQFAQDSRYSEAIGYPSVATLQEALHANETFISYFRHVGGLGRLCVTKFNAHYSVSALQPDDLRRDIKLLHNAVTVDYDADEELDSQFPAIASLNLKNTLFGGLEACMVPGSHLIVALPRDVSGVPLAALLNEEPPRIAEGYDLRRARWLVRDFSFSVVISARHFLGTRSAAARFDATRSYLGIGNPNIETPSADASPEHVIGSDVRFRELRAIPDTAEEIKAVARLFPSSSSDILLGDTATEEHFRTKPLGAYDIIHFATHGIFKGEVAGLSDAALLLTSKDAQDAFNDGILSASEISRLSLRARLIVLAACNSARIDPNSSSQAITDLQAAFSIAGSPTLLASLWSVDTATARTLVTTFFANWKQEPAKSASKVLAGAIRHYLDNADRPHQHPRFWASFAIFGYGGTLEGDSSDKQNDAINIFQVIPNSTAGEIYDAHALEADTVLSMSGDWNGAKYAGIVAKVTQQGSFVWKSRSFEIGAGALAFAHNAIFAAGYTSEEHPIPAVRKLTNSGALEWEKRFDDLKGRVFVAITSLPDGILVATGPSLSNSDPNLILIKIDGQGSESKRVSIPSADNSFVIGKAILLARIGDDVVVAINSQEPPHLDVKKPNVLGMPTWCKGALTTNLFWLNSRTLALSDSVTIPDTQTYTLSTKGQRVLLGGEFRSVCGQSGSARVLELLGKAVAGFWQDDDPFPSLVNAITDTLNGFKFLVRRQRPLGIRSMEQRNKTFERLRWADNDESIYEISLVETDDVGKKISQLDSTFGSSVFVQGLMGQNGQMRMYGAIAGHPGMSLPLQ